MLEEQVTDRSVERVITGLGTVRGVQQDGVVVFHGIPYAAPPIAERRFAPPKAARAWSGVLDATRPAAIAPQSPSRVYASMGPVPGVQSEDCLTLTVSLPHGPVTEAPVIVWFHGGGFATGGGALPWYDASALARHGFVVVAVNYRLGAAGFLALPGCLPGNFALLDEEAALQWVQRHVAAFGGDPGRVTVMGQSGGAHNIASLLTMPRARGLFARAILMSPPLGIGLQPVAEAERNGSHFVEALGLHASDPDLLTRLRATPVADMLDAQLKTAMAMGTMHQGNLCPPLRPTSLYPHEIAADRLGSVAARNAAAWGVDVMIGWTREEAALFYFGHPMIAEMTDPQLADHATFLFGSDAAAALADIRRRWPDATPGRHFLYLVTDASFRHPALAFAGEMAEAGGNVFVYAFDWQSPCADLAAAHCLELPFVFGTRHAWRDATIMQGANDAVVDRLSGDMIDRWTRFAASGDPGFASWHDGDRPVMHFDETSWLEQ